MQDMAMMQLLVLEETHDKEIVIETLPTSNVMIGHHHSYSSYHLYNWYRWGKIEHKPIPPIVLGSDDAGIFATNIFNEYCNATVLNVSPYKVNIWINDLLEKLAKDSTAEAAWGLFLPSAKFYSIHLLRHMATGFATEKTTLRHLT